MNTQPVFHHRTQLNNEAGQKYGIVITYSCVQDGPQHAPTWTAYCMLDGIEWGRSDSLSTKNAAKEKAASDALNNFQKWLAESRTRADT
ncbi:hypothetical protein BDQ17DRAFT_1437228 [Cyathus striatus]|nr:hypothetical protein BDQ17DRAFT_1437228 [Cyathus striatus]